MKPDPVVEAVVCAMAFGFLGVAALIGAVLLLAPKAWLENEDPFVEEPAPVRRHRSLRVVRVAPDGEGAKA